MLSMLEVFDAPSMLINCTFRLNSTVPLQSLNLLNSKFARLRARAFAKRLSRHAASEPDDSIVRAFLIAFARRPTKNERQAADAFLLSQQKIYEGKENQARRVWTDFCQMLFSANVFLYVE